MAVNTAKWLSSLILLCTFSMLSKAQGWVQEGAYLQNDSAFLIIEGTNAHFTATGNAKIAMHGPAEISLTGNWINNSNTVLFTGNEGKVFFNGGAQRIQGTMPTGFPTLETGGTGTKTMDADALVGGAYGRGTGQLILSNTGILELNANRLTVNNPSPDAIADFAGRGFILGETGPAVGYGEIEWVIRNAATTSSYTIPLGTNLYFRYDVNGTGTQSSDSGFIRLATYPTNNLANPNNRPMATGVAHTNNEFGIENSLNLTDRYWMLESGGYSMNPDLSLYFKYDAENGGNNLINEANLGAVRWNSSSTSWSYPVQGTADVSGDYVLLNPGSGFQGIWTLSDTTPCPTVNWTNSRACRDQSVVFTDLSSVLKGRIMSRLWDFNNGILATDSVSLNTFNTSSIFNVKLKITAESGCMDSLTQSIAVQPTPMADFSVTDTCSNATARFSFTGNAPGSVVGTYNWTFGDGTGSGNKDPLKVYGGSGIYAVTLWIDNVEGCADTIIKQVEILESPTASFTVGDVCEGDSSFLLNTSDPGSGMVVKYTWDLGVAGIRNTEHTTELLTPAGNYPVQLIVENSVGCVDTATGFAVVHPTPDADFTYTPASPVISEFVRFADGSTGANKWFWNFGDGSTDLLQNPDYAFTEEGGYPVTLYVENDFGCMDSLTRQVVVQGAGQYWIPSAFTPDARDELNNTFGLNTSLSVKEYKLAIYSRWGEKLFESDDYAMRWDGTYRGTDVQSGTYLYTLSFRNSASRAFHYSGEVLLLR